MASLVIAGKRPFENGDSSLSIYPPRYKRRKVSAIRDFPDGCGPNAIVITAQKNEEGTSSQKEGEILRNLESSGNLHRDLCEVVNKENKEEKDESKSHDVDNKLVEARVVLDLIESSHDIGTKMLGNGTIINPCSFPYYPMPQGFVWREPKYPPRRRVSAVRDFPLGCGRNVVKLDEVENVGQREERSKGSEIGDSNHANIVGEVGDGNVIQDKEQDFVSKEVGGLNENEIEQLEYNRNDGVDGLVFEGGDTLEHFSKGNKSPLIKSYELKGKEEIIDKNCGGLNENEIEELEYNRNDERDTPTLSDELNEDLIVYVKDKSKRKKSIGVPCRNVRLQEENRVIVGTRNKYVIVQGLMALNSPWSQGKGVVTKTPTTSNVKKIKEKKKCNFSGQDSRKRSPSKSKGDEKLVEKSTMIIPYTEEDIDNVSRPLDTRYDDESSENDDVDDFQLLPRTRPLEISLPPFGATSSSERGIRSKVRETLRLYQALYRKLLQEEETKSKDQAIESKRTDLQAMKILKDRGMYINTNKVIGSVPGVEVGDIFNYRTELAIIGLHGPLQGGIDTMKLGKETVAVSIVASGGYANDVDSSDVLIYTGQGGNATGKDKQPEDQKLEKGNLALKNCIDKKTLVRVIRGFKESKPSETGGRAKTIATYTYDGLYTVDRYFHDLGPHGKLVYKFELNRVPGQPELAWKELKQSKKHTPREGRLVADISGGKENAPISVVNDIDDERPPVFKYITTMMYPDWCQPIPSKGCDCKSGCSDSMHCACASKNGGEIPFNYNGAIVQAKPLVYECGPLCRCPPSCHNRVSQNGIKLPLEIFKTSSMGWGVRCLSAISSGSFICEYIGELLDDKEAEQRTGSDEYLFDIGQNYNDPTLWEGLSDLLPELASSSDSVVDVGFTIDAARSGNIGRFINHSCSPNLYAQNVLYDHEDKRIPHIMFFAAENIPPLQELTYHYNYKIDEVYDAVGNIKKKSCYCGSAECTGRMY